MRIALSIILFIVACLFSTTGKAQAPALNPDSVLYKKSWSAGMRIRSDGFGAGAEFTRSRKFRSSLLYQVQFAFFRNPKQFRQQSQFGGGGLFGSEGFRPFVYGKQNTLFTLYGGVGQKILLAEKGKRHGVQIFFKYAGGFTLAILKPYWLRVVPPPLTSFTEDDIVDVGYEEGVDNSFLDENRIVGAAGFRKGWKLKAAPGIHAEVGMQFDWAKDESFIKELEIGVAADFYFWRLPVMVQDNKFLYPSVYVGFMMGKRKRK